MRLSIPTAFVAVAIFFVSWFLPVYEDAAALSKNALPGWEAMRVALSPLVNYQELSGTGSFWNMISVVSGLTNFWFWLSVVMIATGRNKIVATATVGLAISFIVNMGWLISDARHLEVGYFLWLVSFALLAAAGMLRLRALKPTAGVVPV